MEIAKEAKYRDEVTETTDEILNLCSKAEISPDELREIARRLEAASH